MLDYSLKKRDEIPEKYRWDLSLMYENDEAWYQKVKEVSAHKDDLLAYKGKLNNARSIADFLVLETKVRRELRHITNYAFLRLCEDGLDERAQQMFEHCNQFVSEIYQATSFIEPEVLNLDFKLLKDILDDPALFDFRTYFERLIKHKEHYLSAQQEQVLASLTDILYAPEQMALTLMDADLSFEPAKDSYNLAHEVNDASYIALQMNADRELRKNSFKSFFKAYQQHQNTFASIYATSVKTDVIEAKLRNYESSLEMHLFKKDLPISIYNNLIKTMRNFLPLMHRYQTLRKELLELDELHYYDTYVSLINESPRRYSYEEAQELIIEAVGVLGDDYQQLIKRAFEQRWIDVYPNKGKRNGAFSILSYDSPAYIMLNYNETLADVLTLAHELGHSLHSWHCRQQPPQYAEYTSFIAEVASTLNENLLLEQLLLKAEDDKERLIYLNRYLEGFKGSVFRQSLFAEFERLVHNHCEKGGVINAPFLNETYLKLVKLYFGESLVIDEEVACEWARIPHFYRPFSVYAYATGFSSAVALSEKILKEGHDAVVKYRQFLAMGSSEDPIMELKHAGVDLEKSEFIEVALQKFESVMNEFIRITESLKEKC